MPTLVLYQTLRHWPLKSVIGGGKKLKFVDWTTVQLASTLKQLSRSSWMPRDARTYHSHLSSTISESISLILLFLCFQCAIVKETETYIVKQHVFFFWEVVWKSTTLLTSKKLMTTFIPFSWILQILQKFLRNEPILQYRYLCYLQVVQVLPFSRTGTLNILVN